MELLASDFLSRSRILKANLGPLQETRNGFLIDDLAAVASEAAPGVLAESGGHLPFFAVNPGDVTLPRRMLQQRRGQTSFPSSAGEIPHPRSISRFFWTLRGKSDSGRSGANLQLDFK